MLGVDDSNFKLLKMKEKQLELSETVNEDSLKEYRILVEKIDNLMFEKIKDKLRIPNYRNQTLLDELSFLDEVIELYDQLVEFQASKKRIYIKYSDNDLILSNLDVLDINGIRERASVINGYLVNIDNVDRNKKDVDEKNEQLSYEAKKKENQTVKIEEFEEEIKNTFLNACGEKITEVSLDGSLYSLKDEYLFIGIDILDVLNDASKISTLFAEEMKSEKELDEKLKAANICYNNNPSFNSKEILEDIKIESANSKYKITLIKILDLVSKKFSSYDEAKEKREKILDLIKYRFIYLKYVGIRYIVDPFGKIEACVNEQLIAFKKMNDNTKTIAKLRKEISDLNTRIEDMLNQNIEYLAIINSGNCVLREHIEADDTSLTKVIKSEGILIDKKIISPNEVVDVRTASKLLNFDIIRDKTRSVIKRVFEIVNVGENNLVIPKEGDAINEQNRDEIVPELIIESMHEAVFDEKEAPAEKDKMKDLFTVIEPFEMTPMFVDRSDDGYDSIMTSHDTKTTSSDSDVLTNESYDFWKLPEEKNEDDDKSINSTISSLDDQVDKLLNKPKSRQLVA